MSASTINVLIFEDNPADVLFLREALTQDALNTFALTVVERLCDGLPLLTTHSYEVVLLDLGLPDSRGLATFEQVQHVAPELPIVIFSGNADEEAAVLAVRAGAQEYVVKGPLGYAVTGRTIRHAIERQNLRQSLRASEQRFSIAFHASPAAQIITAVDSRQLVDVNDAFCRLTGYAHSELIGHTSQELNLWTEVDRQVVLQQWQLHHRVHDVEISLRTRSGAIRTVLASLEPLDLNGQPCVISTVLDITDRKRAEVQLRESEVLLRQVLESSPDSTFALDRDYRFLIDNQRHQHELVASGGHPFEVGEPMLSPDYPAEVLDFWRAAYDRALAGETFNLEGSWVDLNGQSHAHENRFSPLRDATGAIIGVLVVAHDITDRKNAENALIASEKKLRSLVESQSHFVIRTNLAGNYTYWNAQFEKVFGWLYPQGIQDAYALDSICDYHHQRTAKVVEQCLAHPGQIFTVELDKPGRNGSVCTTLWDFVCLTDEHHQPVEIQCMGTDITERKHAEETLAQTRNSLVEAQKIAHLGSFEYVAATQTTVWSEEEYRIYGLDPAGPSPAYDVMLQQCIHPDDATLLHETFSHAIQCRSVYELEHRIVRPDGSVRWVYDRAQPYFDEQGELVRFVGTTLDITERKRAEAAIRQWADAFEHCAHGIALGDPVTNRIVACNPAFARLHHCAVSDIVGNLILSVYAPADRDHVQASVAQADRLGQVQYEARMLRRDGSTFPVQMDVVSVRDANGRLLYRVATAQDITERKQAETALRKSEAKFRSYIENSPLAIFVINAAGRSHTVNRAAQDLLGYDLKTLSDLTLPELIADEDFEVAMQGFVELQANKVMVAELRLKRRTGDHVWVILRAVKINNDTYLAFCADVTARKQAEAALAQLNAELEERVTRRTLELAAANERLTELDRLKSKFVSDVTHELRTPITSLILSLELLESGKPEKHADYLSRALQQGLRMKTLIEDILDVSRLDRDKADLTLAPLDLNAVLSQVVTTQQARAEAAGLTLTFEPAVDLPVARGDLNRLSQVATNLIANALNYTSTGTVRVRSFRAAERLGFEVQDTGMGIAPEDLTHLFQRFYRGQNAIQSSVRGTGLGLSIAKEIVEAHGGTLEVDSQLGVGSTFRVWLPVISKTGGG